ncbi:MAG: glycine--tRNA ligase subunit beta [Buchnera aphidicola (Nurudea shiraii)]
MNKTFLLEIGTEELPPKSLLITIECLKKNIISLLSQNYIEYSKISCFSTPRRLAIKIEKLNTNIKKIKKNHRGPSISNAFDNLGNPTQSTKCWMKKIGITIDQTSRIIEKKREWISYEYYLKHQTIEKKLIEITINSIKHISVPNSMQWNSTKMQFSRPIRNIVMLLDEKIIKGKILGLSSNRSLFWNIFTKDKKIDISHANQYPEILFQHARVIADYDIRKTKIKTESEIIVKNIKGFLKINNLFLDEITSLVEWPAVFLGSFDKKFLNLPYEILTYIIENQQKCFSIYNKENRKITNNFIIISNNATKDPHRIISGNENILNSRFSDATFFFKKDTKIPLKEYQSLLKNIVFQNSLGSIFNKIQRMKELISWIVQFTKADLQDCIQAVTLCKCDLVTNMVFEFPEMQGIVGMYYALKDNEKRDISEAIKEHYFPRFSNDKIPSNPISFSLALTDKIDTLVGLFIIEKNLVSKDKDPFSLRRLAIGIIKIVLKRKIFIEMSELLEKSLNIYKKIVKKHIILKNLKEFILKKLYFIFIKKKYSSNIIKSVLATNITNLVEIEIRIQTLSNIHNSKIFTSLITIHKRISNILQSFKEISSLYDEINFKLIKTIEEKKIVQLIFNIQKKMLNSHFKNDHTSMLIELNNFNEPISNFFKKVKIQDRNNLIKINRLTILNKIKELFLNTADFSFLY